MLPLRGVNPTGRCRFVGQRRTFALLPGIPQGLRMFFAEHFRGRGDKKRAQLFGTYDKASYRNKSFMYGMHTTPRRLPDIDDPRPPVVGFKTHLSELDHDGSLKVTPYEEYFPNGRRVMQGLYCDFREIYNQHYTFISLYGGGPWDGKKAWELTTYIAPTATVAGFVRTEKGVYIFGNTILRGDLNRITIGCCTYIMEGCVITTDGNPKNTNKPGRVSKINEGETHIGRFSIIHPNTLIDSAYIGDYVEIGEGCKVGNGAVMERFSSLEPGSVLLAQQRVPRFEIWGGNPARKVGYRQKDLNKWLGRIDAHHESVGKSELMEQQFRANTVAATRSSEIMGDIFTRQIERHHHNLPPKVKEYLDRFTVDVPLWELYKNTTRLNVRPGVKKGMGWNIDPNKSRWYDQL